MAGWPAQSRGQLELHVLLKAHHLPAKIIKRREMDTRLYKDAIRGDVTMLQNLLNQEQHLLDGVTNENPLHVAAQFGHVNFAEEILSRKPEYAHELNLHGMYPLHLASQRGHVEVVKLLLEKDAGVCFVHDKRGRTPLHIAAMKGRVEVLKELILAEPTGAWVLTDEGEPILHLCANHNQLEALKMLIQLVDDDEFVNMKDNKDNSILHLLASEIQTEGKSLFLHLL